MEATASKLTIFKEIFMCIFAVVIVSMGIAMVSALIFHSVPPENKDIINVSLGTVLAMCMLVVNYYYSSSKSSADKTAMLANSSPAPTSSVTISETKNPPANDTENDKTNQAGQQ